MAFPFYLQADSMDCGPACLRMIAKHYGRNFKLQTLRQLCEINREGVSLLGISNAGEKIGFRTLGLKLNEDQLNDVELPCVLHWRQYHFVVLYKIKNKNYYIADPGVGLIVLNQSEFMKSWKEKVDTSDGIALLISPTPQFYEQEEEKSNDVSWTFLIHYLVRYKQLIAQLFLGLGIGSLLQLIAPFLTQSIVDIGINTKNLNFIYIILIAQIVLILGRVSVEFIRSWILLHISTRINVSILTDFLIKLMKLPMSFFDTKKTGDIMQRMNDQKNIQSFLTGSALSTFFALFNLVIFSVVLAYYNMLIFAVFSASSLLYAGWIIIFLKQRRNLNYKSLKFLQKIKTALFNLSAACRK